MNLDKKHSLNVLENQIRLQNSAYTIRKNLIFCVLCTLFDKYKSVYSALYLLSINLNILKNPT